MGNGWAVGSATLLGLVVVILPRDLLWFAAPALAVWAYALVMTAQGARTGLLAALLYAPLLPAIAIAGAWPVASATSIGLAASAGLVSAATTVALAREVGRRKGRLYVASLLGLCAPMLLVVVGIALARV